MSENGPIPNPDDCLTYDAPWAYFMSWSNLVQAQNTDAHITDVFNNKNVLTLENPSAVHDNSTVAKSEYQIYPNPAKDIVHIKGPGFTLMEIIDLKGQIVFSTTMSPDKINIQNLDNGIYIMKIFNQKRAYMNKLLINH